MTARFKVVGQFERVRATPATVTIDRRTNLVTIRPLRRRRVFTTRLDQLAELVVWRTLGSPSSNQLTKWHWCGSMPNARRAGNNCAAASPAVLPSNVHANGARRASFSDEK